MRLAGACSTVNKHWTVKSIHHRANQRFCEHLEDILVVCCVVKDRVKFHVHLLLYALGDIAMCLLSAMKEKLLIILVGIEEQIICVENSYDALLILFLQEVQKIALIRSTNGRRFWDFVKFLTNSRRLNGRTRTATLIATSDMIGGVVTLFYTCISYRKHKNLRITRLDQIKWRLRMSPGRLRWEYNDVVVVCYTSVIHLRKDHNKSRHGYRVGI